MVNFFISYRCCISFLSIYIYLFHSLYFAFFFSFLNISGLSFTVFFIWRNSPPPFQWARASSFTRFLDHYNDAPVCRAPLVEWSARRRDVYLTTHNTHNTQTSMPPVGFVPTISAGERPQTYALGRAATGTGFHLLLASIISLFLHFSLL